MKYTFSLDKNHPWTPAAAWYFRNFSSSLGVGVEEVKKMFIELHSSGASMEVVIDNPSVAEEADLAPGLKLELIK